MRTWLCLMLVILLTVLLAPAVAMAADFQFHVSIVNQADGLTTGEVWWNGRLLCRVRLVGTEVPASASAAGGGMLVVPEILRGMFVVKLAES